MSLLSVVSQSGNEQHNRREKQIKSSSGGGIRTWSLRCLCEPLMVLPRRESARLRHRACDRRFSCNPEEQGRFYRDYEYLRDLRRALSSPTHLLEADCKALVTDLTTKARLPLSDLPIETAYGKARPARIARRQARLHDRPLGALAWAGRPTHPNEASRSLPLSTCAPLASTGSSGNGRPAIGRTSGNGWAGPYRRWRAICPSATESRFLTIKACHLII